MALLAMACGGTAAAVGHSQNLWQFTRTRWEPTGPGGGGGDAPPRYFSNALWGTIIYEDEWALLPLSDFGVNDQITSLEVLGGRWRICRRKNERRCREVGPGDIEDRLRGGFNNSISSLVLLEP